MYTIELVSLSQCMCTVCARVSAQFIIHSVSNLIHFLIIGLCEFVLNNLTYHRFIYRQMKMLS